MRSQLSVTRILGAVIPLLVLGSATSQIVTPGCWRLDNSPACYVPGMGVNCGNYSCPHIIITNDPHSQCVSATRGRFECDYVDGPGSLCHMLLRTCSPPSGCVDTGEVHHVYYIKMAPAGAVCP